MIYREGAWLAVGWCHLRREIRSFRVDRMQTAEMAAKPKSPDFERPADFDVKAYAQRSPWTFVGAPAVTLPAARPSVPPSIIASATVPAHKTRKFSILFAPKNARHLASAQYQTPRRQNVV